MTKITYTYNKIKSIEIMLNDLLDTAVIIPNRKLYFDILKVKEELLNNAQFQRLKYES
jgi:hypothetical protein